MKIYFYEHVLTVKKSDKMAPAFKIYEIFFIIDYKNTFDYIIIRLKEKWKKLIKKELVFW